VAELEQKQGVHKMLGFVQPAIDGLWKKVFDWMRNHPRTLKCLDHIRHPLSGGGYVIVLDNGALIRAEAEAMLQALHSRSVGGFFSHLKELVKKGAERFMATFYVGYGHKSIGDCGTVTVFIEGVSMLAAKAVQDFLLYCGQEASTRYIDFVKQIFINPAGEESSKQMLERWRQFYLDHMESVKEHLRQQYPKQEGEKSGAYEKAIAARAFDIMRGFLPAGASTNLAWHSNLRQLADHLLRLRNHPLPEVQEIGLVIETALCQACPSSFAPEKRDPDHYDLTDPKEKTKLEGYLAVENYTKAWMKGLYLLEARTGPDGWSPFRVYEDGVNRAMLSEFSGVMRTRPRHAELPKIVGTAGVIGFDFMLDFGSFRDVHLQRSVIQRMPSVTWKHGFHPWYLDQLPDEVREKAIDLLSQQEGWLNINERGLSRNIQYYVAMGYQQPCRLIGDLAALTYIVELRGTRFVHPTLVEVALQMADVLLERFARYGLVLHMDDEPGRFDVRRGEQDIVRRD